MKRRERRWNELQTRWVKGDSLSAAEESERLAYAEQDALARRELELFAELRARAAAPDDPVPAQLITRVLEGLKGVPRLRLVTSSVDDATERLAPRPFARPRAIRVAVGSLLLATASAIALFVSSSERPPAAAPPTALRAPLPPSLARAELVLSAGEVLVAGNRLRIGQRPLAQGESVSTGEGRACLTIDPGIDVCLAANSSVELESLTAQSVRVRVAGGMALAALTPREVPRSFALVTGDVSATAHGTTYAVRRGPDETEVIVVEGEVEVTRGADNRELVDAHSRVIVPASSEPFVRTPIGRSDEARLVALRATHKLWAGAAVGVLDLALGPSMLQASVDDEGALPLPLQAFVGAGMHRVGWRDSAGFESTSWIEIAAGETRRVAPPEQAKVGASELAVKPSAATLLERARRELGAARPRQALALYDQLRSTYPTSVEARTVLVTMGKLELELGHAQRALGHFEAYLRNEGTLRPEALAGRARALRVLGRAPEERRAIQQYLAAHPNGFEAPSFAKRLRELGQP
jgi:hypothetical protein